MIRFNNGSSELQPGGPTINELYKNFDRLININAKSLRVNDAL